MGLIIKSLEIIGTRGRRKVKALFDTGASCSLINEAVARKIADPVELPQPKTFHAAVGTFRAHLGIFADLVIRGKRLYTSLTVVKDLDGELIIGADFMQRWHIRLSPKTHRIILDPRALRLVAVGSRHWPR